MNYIMKNVEKLKERVSKFKAIAISAAVGISAVAGAGALAASDGPQDVVDTHDLQEEADSPKEISNQIDENTDKLNALSSSESKSNTEYELMGC